MAIERRLCAKSACRQSIKRRFWIFGILAHGLLRFARLSPFQKALSIRSSGGLWYHACMANTDIENVEEMQSIADLSEAMRWDLLPKSVGAAVIAAGARPEYWQMPEHEIREVLKEQLGGSVSGWHLVVRLKMRFNEAYEKALALDQKISRLELVKGVVAWHNFIAWIKQYPALFPYMITPLAEQKMIQKHLNYVAEDRMFEILSYSPVVNGRLDSKIAEAQIKLYNSLQDRIHGGVMQRVQSETKAMNVNVNSTQNAEETAKTIQAITSIEELDKRIAAVKEKRAALQTVAQPIEPNLQKLMRPDQVETNQDE